MPIVASVPSGQRDPDDDGDGDDQDLHRVVLKASRSAFIASVKAGIAVGSIDARSAIPLQLYAGATLVGADSVIVK